MSAINAVALGGSSDQALNKQVKKKRPSFLRIFHRSPKKGDEVLPVANQVSGHAMGSSSSVVSVGDHITAGSSAAATPQNHTVASPRSTAGSITTMPTNTGAGIITASSAVAVTGIPPLSRKTSVHPAKSAPSIGNPGVNSQHKNAGRE
jgi:hypothetical protein